MPIAFDPLKEYPCHLCTLSLSAPPPNRPITSALPVQFFYTPSSEEVELSDVSPEISDTTDTTPDEVTKAADNDDEATSSGNKSSETAVTPTPARTKPSLKRQSAQ
jgi:hypothetical protein